LVADANRGLLLSTDATESPTVFAEAHHTIEAVIVSPSGAVLVLGWIDDDLRPLDSVTLVGPGWRVVLDAASLVRRVRPDVAQALERPATYPYGYLGFVFGARRIRTDGPCEACVTFRDGGVATATLKMRTVDDEELRTILMSHVPQSPQAFASLAAGLGDQIIRFNRAIADRITAHPYVERFGGSSTARRGSIVVCLYGRPEFHFVQTALFSTNEGVEDYEFIFVSNSPELADTLLDSARKAHRIHGLDQTMVLLPANAGFGAANNVAANSARSDRLLIVNPDVLPRDPAWARRHGELVDTRPDTESRLFGAALYYGDGCLMHGGMYFESDTAVVFDRDGAHASRRVRVEHFGKGAPTDTPRFTRARPVPAVTGAFISVARPWFEHLGGFTEDYVFGHYEDADLCLKSLAAGTAPWLQDLRLWHLEGQSSPPHAVQQSASLVNQWLLSSRWGGFIDDALLGPSPSHPLLCEPRA